MHGFEKQLERIKRLDSFARTSRRGCADDIAEQLGISRSQFYELVKVMKRLGLPIQYDSEKGCYNYEEDVEFIFQVKRKPPNVRNEEKK